MNRIIQSKTHIVRRSSAVVALACVISALLSTSSLASVFVVNSTGESHDLHPGDGICDTNGSGQCTLRAAIEEANAHSGDDAIEIELGQQGQPATILLDSPLPAISSNISFSGPGADYLTIAPSDNFTPTLQTGRLFVINSGTVAIRRVTISGRFFGAGSPKEGQPVSHGGGIFNFGNLTVANCILSNNVVNGWGGAIENHGQLVVKQTTLNNNIAQGTELTPDAHGGAIANRDSGHLYVVSSTVSGNIARGGDLVNGEFLTRKERSIAGSDTYAQSYYAAVDPLDPLANKRMNLGQWWTTNGFTATGADDPNAIKQTPDGKLVSASAAYLNNNDLGFGRDMHIHQLKNGDIAAYVSNYSFDPPRPDQNPLDADAAQAKNPARAIATVCMEYSPVENTTVPVVKFFVYAGDQPGNGILKTDARRTFADLDGRGRKFVPQLCMECHGGLPNSSPAPNQVSLTPSYFREFDTASFMFPRPGKRIDYLTPTPDGSPGRDKPTATENFAFHKLNRLVELTNPALPGQVGYAITELIQGWYPNDTVAFPGPTPSSADTQKIDFVPGGWQNVSPDGTVQTRITNLYLQVVAKSCRTCHVAQSPDFASYTQFAAYKDFNGDLSPKDNDIAADVFTKPNKRSTTDPSQEPKVMPHALVTFSNFWRSGRQNTLASFHDDGVVNQGISPWGAAIGFDKIVGATPSPTPSAKGGKAHGGGIFNGSQAFFNITASTIALNRAIGGVGTGQDPLDPTKYIGAVGDALGGGIRNAGSTTPTPSPTPRSQLGNTLIATNFATARLPSPTPTPAPTPVPNALPGTPGPEVGLHFIPFDVDKVSSRGSNLFGYTGNTDLDTSNRLFPDVILTINQNPKLGALANNGGATLTHALLAGSPAIDAGSVAHDPTPGLNNPAITLDQRRYIIPFDNPNVPNLSGSDNSGTDIGAFEVGARPQADLKVTITDNKTSALPGQTDTYTITVTSAGPTRSAGAHVTDAFPAAFTNVHYTATQSGGASGFTKAGTGNINDQVTLPAGSVITYTATGTISPSASGTLSDTVTITRDASDPATDPNLNNNTATDTDTL
jgi:uncharacterized repeat protein (TIGR01451 family)